MKRANLIEDNEIIVQIDYEVEGQGGKNYGIHGTAYLPFAWDSNGSVVERDFFSHFSSNWECDAVLRLMGEDYEKEVYENDLNRVAYYQTGAVYGLINMSRALLLIHRLLELELSKTNTYMEENENRYANSFNLFEQCTLEIEEL